MNQSVHATNTRDEIFCECNENAATPDEPWMIQREAGHQYCAQADFVLGSLDGKPGRCLVVGSPLFEAIELRASGWHVTYADVRIPPIAFQHFVHGDAATTRFPKEAFDAASSTCVLCHAGLGRYGDPVVEDADEKILANIFQALKPGAKFAVMFGPVCGCPRPVRLGTRHRIYTEKSAAEIILNAGFRSILQVKIFDSSRGRWKPPPAASFNIDRDYLSMLVQKC